MITKRVVVATALKGLEIDWFSPLFRQRALTKRLEDR